MNGKINTKTQKEIQAFKNIPFSRATLDQRNFPSKTKSIAASTTKNAYVLNITSLRCTSKQGG